MNGKSNTSELSPERLAQLLKIGARTSRTSTQTEEQAKSELLDDWLSASLPLDAVLLESLPKVVARACRQLRPLSQDSFGALLQDARVDIAVIKKIKGYSKKLVESAESDAEHDAAAAVYYAAIANALLFHHQRITQLSYEDMEDAFSRLSGDSWLTPELTVLFRRARKACRKKLSSREDKD